MSETYEFGWALDMLRAGAKVTREEWVWRGDEVFVVLQAGYPEGIPINGNTSRALGMPEGTVCRFGPYLLMRTAQDEYYVPWVASQTDLLASDWFEVS